MNDRNAPRAEDLLAMLECCVDALWMSACDYMCAAGEERDEIEAIWNECLAGWTDAEGQRVAKWLAQMNHCYRHPDRSSRIGGFAKAVRHVHRLVLQKLMRGYRVQWPPGGLMLDFPKVQPGETLPRKLRNFRNVDVEPGYWDAMTICSPDGSSVTTYFDEHGHAVRETRAAPDPPEPAD